MIECDVKQAVGLLEMSLSGLVSAETALKRWKGEIPAKVGGYLCFSPIQQSSLFCCEPVDGIPSPFSG